MGNANVHLICNAHLDPVWLWTWEEGAAEALSTFGVAADFCEQYDGFVFNHNEAVLYEWIEEYDQDLFERIRRLVAGGRWHIMGGWYLQPDCNMSSGESLVRQVLHGRRYFVDRFGVTPKTAINFDPFGHSRGIVQILAKAGYDSYIFCRPGAEDLELPAEEFRWVGFDGSSVTAHRAFGHYLSQKGQAAQKIKEFLADGLSGKTGLLLWGIGNHGGGASKEDLEAIERLAAEINDDVCLIHSTPEAYFAERRAASAAPINGESGAAAEAREDGAVEPHAAARADNGVEGVRTVQAGSLPEFADHLNPWGPGCYTSQIRVKQYHRRLENELLATEKTVTQAFLRGAVTYPSEDLRRAVKDLMFSEFHDILPGSGIPGVETAAIERMGHGLSILSALRTRALFAMASDLDAPPDGVIPLLVYNPHPFPVEGVFETEFQPAAQNWSGTFTSYRVWQVGSNFTDSKEVPAQIEKEDSHVGVDWRKRVAFCTTFQPAALTYLHCEPYELPAKPEPATKPHASGAVVLSRDGYSALVGATGLLESYVVGGAEILGSGGIRALVLADSDDAWESQGRRFDRVVGEFKTSTPPRVIEDGPVRTRVEAVFAYERSELVIAYDFPREGTELSVRVRVMWAEKKSMLKLAVPLADVGSSVSATDAPGEPARATGEAPPPDAAGSEVRLLGQTAFGVQELFRNGDEAVAQRWAAAVLPGGATTAPGGGALTIINDGTYGLSLNGFELRLTLLRSPAYSALPGMDKEPPVPTDRFVPRMDQGERHFCFWLNAGGAADRLARVDREATIHGEAPQIVMMFPRGQKRSVVSETRRSYLPAVTLSDDVVQLSALKISEDGAALIVRLFEPTGTPKETNVAIPLLGVDERVRLNGFEVATFRVELAGVPSGSRVARGVLAPADLCETPPAFT